MKRILTGLQPSGELTLGSLIGGIRQTIKLQDKYDSFIFVPDMHAITVSQDPNILSERIMKNVALYIASGIDPEKNTIFLQSENIYHPSVSWMLECNTYYGELSRMTQFKEKSSKNANFTAGLFTYPVLMASDILIYDANYVPVGIDQKQHVELTRDIALRFNKKYGDTFVIPEPLIPELGAKIMDLQEPTKKMSKSSDNYKGTILLLDSEDVIRKKVLSAVTDSENKIYYDPINKPGISNLLIIYSCLSNLSVKEVENKFKEYNYGNFKKEVANIIIDELNKIQDKYYSLIKSDELQKILDNGRDKTLVIAKQKYELMKSKIGLYR